jgi:hypothetical protein
MKAQTETGLLADHELDAVAGGMMNNGTGKLFSVGDHGGGGGNNRTGADVALAMIVFGTVLGIVL